MLNVAHLLPLSRWLSRSGLVDALTAHYGLPETVAGHSRAAGPRRTAPTTAAASATATRPTRLDRRGVFLLWEVGSCSDTLPEL